MIPHRRPKPWFGPDDYAGRSDPHLDAAERDREIAAWDAAKLERLLAMNLWQRFVYALFYSSDVIP